MNKIIIVDISGKVTSYDLSLYEAICKQTADSVSLLYPGRGLINMVPSKYQGSTNIVKRLVKVFEGLMNYLLLSLLLLFRRVDVLHFEWLPFLEFVGWENYILAFMKVMDRRTKFILTIHNVYPHNMKEKAKSQYKKRFRRMSNIFDSYIVHTQTSKNEVINEFGLNDNNVHICYHGVFKPNVDIIQHQVLKSNKIRILQFGIHSYYKGTDVLVDAISKLPKSYAERISTHIVGAIQKDFLSELKIRDNDNRIEWKPYYLTNEDLYNEIENCDIIVLPYRAISQSGVLLLAIYFNKIIITSNLPSFVETMHGNIVNAKVLDEEMFFVNEDSDSLMMLIKKYIDNEVNEVAVRDRIRQLSLLYTWDNSAKNTLLIYNS